MSLYNNPFPDDPDRHQIWTMLVERDIRAFVAEDWSLVADDFIADGFMGIDARSSLDPDAWRLSFDTLEAYRDEWLRQARITAETEFSEDLEPALIRATILRDIEIEGNGAIVHKKFNGRVAQNDGGALVLRWQSIYRCRKVGGRWKIAGFTGYLPHPLRDDPGYEPPAKAVPAGASQHVTAGPYSPVLEINPAKIVVISGQAAIDPAGTIVGETIEDQTKLTLDNCRIQLETAGCTFADVFKVNVYLTDLDEWGRFNEVYRSIVPEPRPVRTAVGTKLLPGLLVEIEMWAVK